MLTEQDYARIKEYHEFILEGKLSYFCKCFGCQEFIDIDDTQYCGVYTTNYIRAAEEIFEDCSMAMDLLEDLSFAGREYVCIVKKGNRLADAVNTRLIRITLQLKKVPALVAKGDML